MSRIGRCSPSAAAALSGPRSGTAPAPSCAKTEQCLRRRPSLRSADPAQACSATCCGAGTTACRRWVGRFMCGHAVAAVARFDVRQDPVIAPNECGLLMEALRSPTHPRCALAHKSGRDRAHRADAVSVQQTTCNMQHDNRLRRLRHTGQSWPLSHATPSFLHACLRECADARVRAAGGGGVAP